MIKILLLLFLVLGSIFFWNQKKKKENLFEMAHQDFELLRATQIEDNYMFYLEEERADFFTQNLVEAVSVAPVSDVEIKVNNQMIFDLKEMFAQSSNIIIRRGYLGEEESEKQGVFDHKTGYDIDVYLKDHDWTDFTGHKEADDFLSQAYQYGFVLRYPNKKEYQPWHYRYVGKMHAKVMHDQNITLETYIEQLKELKENQIYRVDQDTYLYKTSKENCVVPSQFSYVISSLDEANYIVSFEITKTVQIHSQSEPHSLVEKKVEELAISYDLSLVNYENPVPTKWNPQLVSLTKYLSEDNNSEFSLDENVLKAIKPMLEQSNQLDRHTTYLTSAYRTRQDQQELYETGDKTLVQAPNYSEHQTGLAFDLSNSYKPNTGFTETMQGLWIKQNANQYGFILRYPIDKTEITKIANEQWHFRYVGPLHATIMKENRLVLEEYIELWKPSMFYQVTWNNDKYLFYKSVVEEDQIKVGEQVKEIYYLKGNEYLIIEKQND